MAKKYKVELTDSEINHIVQLIGDCRIEGVYYGNKEQYWKRCDRIVKKICQAIEESNDGK